MLRLSNDLIEFAERLGHLGAELFVSHLVIGAVLHRAPLDRSFDAQQRPLGAFHGFFQGPTAHGLEGVAEWMQSASG
jgi:hypothetical protein